MSPGDQESAPDVESEIGLLLAIGAQLFTSRVSQIVAGAGLTYTQFSLLSHLSGQADCSVSDIAEAMEINQPGVSKVVARLSEEGAIRVQPDPTDSRRKRVSIAAAGRGRLGAAQALLESDGEEWFKDWTPKDLQAFHSHLGALVGWLDANRLGA